MEAPFDRSAVRLSGEAQQWVDTIYYTFTLKIGEACLDENYTGG
jgi:hypothetical protein